jgi:hypothetical protein
MLTQFLDSYIFLESLPVMIEENFLIVVVEFAPGLLLQEGRLDADDGVLRRNGQDLQLHEARRRVGLQSARRQGR